MRIDIQRIEIHNFMSFGDEVFDFSLQDGMSLITGKNNDIPTSKNGCGKSALFSALLYGLYGQLSNKVKSENIANRYLEDKEVRVVVYLDVDNVSYKAVSGMNKRAQGYFSIHKKVDSEYVDITKSTIAETRDYFETQILHCDISLFLRTILLTSEQNYNFFNLKKQDKKEFIERLFDIGIFGEMYDKIHKDMLSSDKMIISHQNQLLVLNQNKEDYNARIKTFEESLVADKKNLEQQIEKVKIALDEVKKNSVEKNVILIEKYEDASKKLFDAKFKVNEQLSTRNLNISKMQQEISHNKRIKTDRKQIIDKHSELFNKLCDDCKKVFDRYHNLSSFKKDIDNAEKANNSLDQQIAQEKRALSVLQEKINVIDDKLQKAQKKLKELNSKSDEAKQMQLQLEKSLSALSSQLQQLQNKVNPYVNLLDDTKAKIASEEKNLEAIEAKYRYLKKAEEIVSQESLKKFIIKDLIGLINSRIKTYLVKMGASFTCIFDENLDYNFVTETGNCELQNFSCGEKKRLEIATCLSFRDFIAQRSNISSNLLIIDEYIDSGIDTLAVESILSILKSFTIQNNQNVFIISHRAEISNELFNRTIELHKDKGISTIHIIDNN